MSLGPLPKDEYDAIYSRVPRLTVEVVISSDDGVLLTFRDVGPCAGLWHLPGGTVRFGEPLLDAVARVAMTELGIEVAPDELLGYIEYPSHLERGIDWPVGVAFLCHLDESPRENPRGRWFAELPAEIHDEQRDFLLSHGLAR